MHADSRWPYEPWETRGDRFSPTLFRGPELPRFPRRRRRHPLRFLGRVW